MCSAPLSVTIAGDDVTSYGRPALMIALNVRVVVSASTLDYEGDPRIKDIYTQVYQEIYSAQPSSMKVSVEIPLDAGVRALQSALIVCFVAYLLSQKLEKNAPISEIQKRAFSLEKKLFQQYSHAQTINSIQGGLMYYRKEFEFYKTIMKLPMKLPRGFLTDMTLELPKSTQRDTEFEQEKLQESEKKCKRLVFAIGQENLEEWKREILKSGDHTDIHLSEGSDTLEESHSGLIVE